MKQTATLVACFTFFTLLSSGQQAALPYFDDFESGSPGWTPWVDIPAGTNWELGTPTTGYTIGAYSGANCWDVNLNSVYSNYAVCYLSTPVFDFTSVQRATVSFWTKYYAEYMWDYLSVQVSVDKGDTWQFMPFPNLINPDGYVQKWIQSSLAVNNLSSYSAVQFRFIFVSDGSIAYDGYSIDDFRIEVDPLSAPELSSPELFSFYPNPSHGEVNFNFPDKSTGAGIVIYDVTGKTVLSQQLADLATGNMMISQLKKGTYSVVYRDMDVVMAKKLVVIE